MKYKKASIYFKLGTLDSYKKAAKLYKDICNPTIDSHDTYRYALSLFNSKEYIKCLQVCKMVQNENGFNKYYSELEADIYFWYENFVPASENYKILSIKYPEVVKYSIRYAVCLFRLNKKEKANQVLRRYAKKVKDSAEDFLNIAYTYVHVGDFLNAVQYADNAIKVGKDNILITKGYLQLWLKELRVGKDEIDSRYVERFQKTLKKYIERFPEDNFLRKFEVSLDNPEDIITKIQEHLPSEDWKDLTQDLFLQRQYPVSLLSSFTGRDIYTTWLNIINNKRFGILNNSGNVEDLNREKAIITKAESVLIDPVALFTLKKLDLLQRLIDSFKNVYVPQKILDVLSSVKSDQKGFLESGGMTLYSEKGKIVRQDIPKPYLETIIIELDSIIDFISNNEKVKIIGKSVGRDEKIDDQRIAEILNNNDLIIKECFIESRHRNIPLLVEDMFYRDTAINAFNIKSFGSLSFVEVMKTKGLIEENYYHDILIELIKSGYHFTIISAPTFSRLIERNNFVINEDVINTVDLFKRQNHDVKKLVGFTSHVIQWVWDNISSTNIREQWTLLILNIIPISLSRKEVYDFFEVQTDKMFHELDLIKKESFKKMMSDWFSSQSIFY